MHSENILNLVRHFLLIFLRVSAIFTFSPVLGRKNIPAIVKIGFSIILSYLLLNIYPPSETTGSGPETTGSGYDLYAYTVACLKELFVGLIIGYVTVLVFSVAYTAGQLIDVQVGFGMSQLFDQQILSNVTITANLLNITMLICFFMTNGHHALIRILSNTFAALPPGNFSVSFNIVNVIIAVFISSLVMGVQVAMPIIAATFISEISLGILMRSMPQMNMFVIGIPLKVLIGLFLLIMISPVFVKMTSPLFDSMYEYINLITEGVAA